MEKKPWYKSKAIWGGVVAGVAAILNAVITQYGDIPSLQLALNILTSLGAVYGIYGRATATTAIGN